MSELKPCPFCGNHVEMVNTKTYPNFERSPAYMKCRTCNYHIAAFDDENLINRWNDRPIEDELRAELAALREQVRWIPVSERLPELLTPCLTVYRTLDGISAIVMRYRYEVLEGYVWIDEEGLASPKAHVTHWMSLPLPPEGE